MDFSKPPIQSEYKDPREFKADAVREFLKKIAFLESSGGKNTDHAVMQTGPHAGTHAVGNYGIMPVTAQDLDRQYKINKLQDIDKFDAQAKLEQDPALQERLAATMASKLLSKNPEEVAAYKWEQGQNSNPSDEDLENSERVRRFRVLTNAK